MLLHDTEVLVSAWSFGWQQNSIAKKPQVEAKRSVDNYSNVASSEFRKRSTSQSKFADITTRNHSSSQRISQSRCGYHARDSDALVQRAQDSR